MDADEILQADMEGFLVDYIRARITDAAMLARYPVLAGFEVDRVEPVVDSKNFPAKLIIVRDDGTNSGEIITGDTSVGVSVLMGDKFNTKDSSLAARVVHAIVRGCARVEVGNPVAAVGQSTGPYLVPEAQPRARWYSTHDLTTVGASL